jgi:DNA-directed RNA polymerase subunit RPC12/RpoP
VRRKIPVEKLQVKTKWNAEINYLINIECPECSSNLEECELLDEEQINGQIYSGEVTCPHCFRNFILVINND